MKQRVILAGNWAWDIYEEALARGFVWHGWEVLPFRTGDVQGMPADSSLLGRLRPARSLKPVNDALLQAAKEVRPDMIFLWRCIDILPLTLSRLRSELPNSTIVVYHNDNPFTNFKDRLKCRHFLSGLRHAHVTAVYRPNNVEEALAHGAQRVELLLPSFIRDLHRPLRGMQKTDVIYVGHYEPDDRMDALLALHEAGVDVQVRGPGWQSVQKRHHWISQQKIERLWGDAYVSALSNARIALAFLSKRHGDVYTRRCFEIPACGSLLMAPRTPQLQELFREGVEAVFWSSTNELVDKVILYLSHESDRAQIAAAGHRRVNDEGHDEYGRAAQVINWLDK